jgi:hypothetical protein
MSDLTLPVEATRDAVTGIQPNVSNDNVSKDNPSQPPALVAEPEPPVLITEHEVMLGTAAAVRPRFTPIARMIGALRDVAAALQLPPPRPHYSHGGAYIERARMAREMDRL